ncbi:MAG: radical SAM family heme chaperone HemW [Clostridiales bacterium]|nr:radical SAM family heme chaperone HemW [Clostridiales bacterium]
MEARDGRNSDDAAPQGCAKKQTRDGGETHQYRALAHTDAHAAYIHIPFCVRKCAYCDFLSFPSCVDQIPEYVEALCREIGLSEKFWGENKSELTSVYFGGGTPSLLSPLQVEKILGALRKVFTLSEDCEITLEANPGTIDEEKLRGFREAGVNRLSIGIQSLDDSVLTALGRIHDAATARQAVFDAKGTGFQNISCDMMLGIPGQSRAAVESTLSFFLQQEIPHVSLYSLILEEGTPMYARYDGDIEKYVSQEEDRELYHLVVNTLRTQGYSHYEISNMAKSGFESRHNMMYWRAENYYAFGLGAHYYLDDERGTHKAETIEEYIGSFVADGVKGEVVKDDIYEVEEKLTSEEKKKEFMMLAFRTGKGVEGQVFEKRFGCSVESAFGEELEKEIQSGLVEKTEGGYRLTEKGFDLANQVFSDYV